MRTFATRSDLAAVLDALRQAGFPEWPFGFRGDGLERIDGAEIARLAFGRTWQGHTAVGEPAFLQFGLDGRSAFRTPTQIETGTAFVDHDLLCDQSEARLLGRPRCGPVYRSREGAGEDASRTPTSTPESPALLPGQVAPPPSAQPVRPELS